MDRPFWRAPTSLLVSPKLTLTTSHYCQGDSRFRHHTHPMIPTPFSTPIPHPNEDIHITYMGCGAAGGWAAATLAISAINTTPFGQFTGIDQNQESIDIFAKRYPQTQSFCGRFNSTATLQQALHSTILIHSGTHQTLANKGRGLADPFLLIH